MRPPRHNLLLCFVEQVLCVRDLVLVEQVHLPARQLVLWDQVQVLGKHVLAVAEVAWTDCVQMF